MTQTEMKPTGVAVWLQQAFKLLLQSSRNGQRGTAARQLRLVETLVLGGKKQLLLVTCGDESFLVGASLDAIHTIVRVGVKSDPNSLSAVANDQGVGL